MVVPTWDAFEPAPGEIVVRVDPGMAFGMAEHATTRGCLRLLDLAVRGGERVADVGTGSGILAITAAKLGAAAVTALEMDPFASEAAERNVRYNGVAERVGIAVRGVAAEGVAAMGPFDGIVANIESRTLVALMPASAGP
ncbi:MAG: 50S ribosomal protein L11 methyltransferase [Gemmatimonadetes bacterium]|nr:50S ribosomal protein L11 methyltransferase [Gemmatimonadota bacterium]